MLHMNLKGKKVIVLGERDGIMGQAIAECVKSAGAEPLLVQTQCFVWTAAGALDLEGQESIKKVTEEHGRDNLVVIIGAPDADSAELYAETVTHGDPTWAGPLAGVALQLPVFHIMEPEITEQVDPAVYEEHLSIMNIALDVDKITQGLNRVRNKMAEWAI
jgi:glycine reductase